MMKTTLKTIIALSIFIAVSCSQTTLEQHNPTENTPISFMPGLTATAVPSKADLYNSQNLIDADHKGNFSVTAFKAGTTDRHFLGMERVYYMYYPENPSASSWRFYDSESNSFYERYWPQTYSLDFLAYMPYDLAGTHVTVDADSQTFTCTLPLDKSGQDSSHEFIYAFEKNQSYESDEGNVVLNFKHPFSAVNFTLGQAHGNTEIHSVGLTGIISSGTFSIPEDEWNLSTTATQMTITVGKTVGEAGSNGLQLNSLIGGPYLAMPQETDGVSITVSFTWNGLRTDATAPLGDGEWLPGHIYTYKLNLGDSQEDIIADVSVDLWTVIDYRNDIDIE